MSGGEPRREKRAVVLLSGGLDSATVLAVAHERGFACHCLSFDYGQRHGIELEAAGRVTESLGAAEHRIIRLDQGSFSGSALTGDAAVPKRRDEAQTGEGEGGGRIPVTYVPARNLVFLSIAVGYAEVIGAADLFVGVNAVDYSGYPDCRPEFVRSFQETANLATKAGVEGSRLTVHTPLIDLSKREIIQLGVRLGVDYGLTHSCYDPDEQGGGEGGACGRCDSCVLRRRGFEQAGIDDPTVYAVGGDR